MTRDKQGLTTRLTTVEKHLEALEHPKKATFLRQMVSQTYKVSLFSDQQSTKKRSYKTYSKTMYSMRTYMAKVIGY